MMAGDYFVVRKNLGHMVRITLKNPDQYTNNEIASAFHVLGGKTGPIMGRSYQIVKNLKETFLFELTDE